MLKNESNNLLPRAPQSVIYWLYAGLVLIFFQVVIGGITRLTDSGLSITEWNVIMGVLPPLNQAEWEHAFQLYKTHAYTQYQQVHSQIDLEHFKFIFFWEWFHRLWARTMGLVFLIGFIYFSLRKQLSKVLILDLFKVVGLAALAAIFGWVMVKSGLNTPQFAWVNAYKLMLHLAIATALISVHYAVCLKHSTQNLEINKNKNSFNLLSKSVIVVITIQILLGGIVAGTKAAMAYPHFPTMDAQGHFIPPVLFDAAQWKLENLINYNKNLFAPAIIQFTHRSAAYMLYVLGLIYAYVLFKHCKNNKNIKTVSLFFGILLNTQMLLGILTVLGSQFKIPVLWGTLHQGVGLLILLAAIRLRFELRRVVATVSEY